MNLPTHRLIFNTSRDCLMAVGESTHCAGGGFCGSRFNKCRCSAITSPVNSNANSAKGSKVNAGGNVTITATGAGQGSDITLQGSNVQAGKATTLKADDQVNIVAAQNTTQENNNSSNKSGSIGVGMQLGAAGTQMGVTVSASAGKGSGAGNSTKYKASSKPHVQAKAATSQP